MPDRTREIRGDHDMRQPYNETPAWAIVTVLLLALATVVGIAVAWWNWQQHLPA